MEIQDKEPNQAITLIEPSVLYPVPWLVDALGVFIPANVDPKECGMLLQMVRT